MPKNLSLQRTVFNLLYSGKLWQAEIKIYIGEF